MPRAKNKKELLQIISEKEKRIELLEDIIKAQERSITWKLWRVFTNLIDRFLPLNTFRRSVYDGTIETIQKLVNGEISILQKIFYKNSKITIKIPSLISTKEEVGSFCPTFPRFLKPKVSIIIATYNNVRFTHQCLDSILKHTRLPYEIIIVDNNSTDETKNFLSKIGEITTILNETNLGFGNACNIGAKVAKAPYLLFLNNDTIVTPNWLPPLAQIMDNIKNCGSVGGKIIAFNGLLQEAGGIISKNGHCKVRGRGKDPNHQEFSYFREVDHCTAACLLVRKKVFLKVNGFDSKYSPAYYEDVDLSMAIKEVGYKIYYQPKSVVYHNQHTSISKRSITYLMIRNMMRFKRKWKMRLKKMNRYEYSKS